MAVEMWSLDICYVYIDISYVISLANTELSISIYNGWKICHTDLVESVNNKNLPPISKPFLTLSHRGNEEAALIHTFITTKGIWKST